MRARPKNTVGRFLVNSSSSGAAILVNIAVLVWVNQYLARRVEADEYALIPLVTALMVFVEILRNMFGGGVPRFMVEADARGDDAEVTRVVSSMLPILCGLSLVLAIFGAVLVWQFDAVVTIDPAYVVDGKIMFALLFALMCSRIATIPLSAGLFVRMHFVHLNVIQLIVNVIRVAILIFLLFEVSTRALWFVASTAIAGTFGLAAEIAYTRWVLPAARFRLHMVSWPTAQKLLSFSLWTAVQGVTSLIQRSFPVLLLNQHSSSVDLAAFHLGVLPDTQLRQLFVALDRPARPALTAVYALNGAGALQKLYYQGGRYYLWVTLFLLPPVLVFAKSAFTLYTGGLYPTAATVLIAILSVYPVVWASAMFFQVANAIGRIEIFNICNIILCAVAVVAVYTSVVHLGLGAVGAALALGASFLVVHLLVIWPLALRLVEGSWTIFLKETVLSGVAPFVAALAACGVLAGVLVVDTWLRLGEVCAVSAVVYVLVLFGFCLSPVDKELLRRVIDRIAILKARAFG